MNIDNIKRSYLIYALLKNDDCEDEVIGFDELRLRLEQLDDHEILAVNIVEDDEHDR